MTNKPSTAWKPGQSGNPKGRPRKGRSLTDALAQAVTQAKRKALAEAALDLALGHFQEEHIKGVRRVYFVAPELAAINFLFDRLDGKVATKIDLTMIIRRAAEAKGLAADDPIVIAAIAEAEGVLHEARG